MRTPCTSIKCIPQRVLCAPDSSKFFGTPCIVPKKIQGWTKAYSKDLFHSAISWVESWLVDEGYFSLNGYLQVSCRPSLTSETMSMFLIFTQGTHLNVKNRWVRSSLHNDFYATNNTIEWKKIYTCGWGWIRPIGLCHRKHLVFW